MSATWQFIVGLLLAACFCLHACMSALLVCTAVTPLYPLQSAQRNRQSLSNQGTDVRILQGDAHAVCMYPSIWLAAIFRKVAFNSGGATAVEAVHCFVLMGCLLWPTQLYIAILQPATLLTCREGLHEGCWLAGQSRPGCCQCTAAPAAAVALGSENLHTCEHKAVVLTQLACKFGIAACMNNHTVSWAHHSPVLLASCSLLWIGSQVRAVMLREVTTIWACCRRLVAFLYTIYQIYTSSSQHLRTEGSGQA
jgi:hypothetical protein